MEASQPFDMAASCCKPYCSKSCLEPTQVIRKSDNDSQKYTLAFLGYGPEDDNVAIELTYNWGKGSDSYTRGDGYAQIALSTEVRSPTWPRRAAVVPLQCGRISEPLIARMLAETMRRQY